MIKRYDMFTLELCGQPVRGEMRETPEGDYILFEDFERYFQMNQEFLESLKRELAATLLALKEKFGG